jgi:hypothetical protein
VFCLAISTGVCIVCVFFGEIRMCLDGVSFVW